MHKNSVVETLMNIYSCVFLIIVFGITTFAILVVTGTAFYWINCWEIPKNPWVLLGVGAAFWSVFIVPFGIAYFIDWIRDAA
jgi:hypothetical protein